MCKSSEWRMQNYIFSEVIDFDVQKQLPLLNRHEQLTHYISYIRMLATVDHLLTVAICMFLTHCINQ